VGRGQIPDIVHVEAQERAHLRLLQKILGAGETFAAQAIEVDPVSQSTAIVPYVGQSHKISP